MFFKNVKIAPLKKSSLSHKNDRYLKYDDNLFKSLKYVDNNATKIIIMFYNWLRGLFKNHTNFIKS